MNEQSDPSAGRPRHEAGHAHASDQPFEYPLRREYVEPDWTRLPGFRDVTTEQWESAQWQRAHTIKNLVELKRALGDLLTDVPRMTVAAGRHVFLRDARVGGDRSVQEVVRERAQQFCDACRHELERA